MNKSLSNPRSIRLAPRLVRAVACVALAAACLPGGAAGLSLDTLQNLSQEQFRELSTDLTAAFSYKPFEPASPLGVTGTEVGVSLGGTVLANGGAVSTAANGSDVFGTLPVPTLRATKGLPYNVDVGFSYSHVPTSGINIYGGELKWAVIPGGGLYLPSVALRAAVTRLNGISQLGFETYSGDVSVSKDFLFLTPYLGFGEVRSRSATDGIPTLSQVNLTQAKFFGGLSLGLGNLRLVAEADSTGSVHSFGLKAGLHF